MSKAASLSSLERLHSAVAEALAEDLEGGNRAPQFIAQVLKFLKDNGIEPARDADNAAVRALADKVNALTAESADAEGFFN